MQFRAYDGEQIREIVNSEQLYEALLTGEAELHRRFRGSMTWKRVSGRDYLYRKQSGDWRSLGPRNPESERVYDDFISGREQLKERLTSLNARLRRSARVVRALGLGRVPVVAARIIRRLANEKLLGRNLLIVGTPSLFAYERMAGGQLHQSLVATADLDLLFDARHRLRLIAQREQEGLIGLLRAADKSFEPLGPHAFRAANNDGYMVDLITPMPANPATTGNARIGKSEDLEAAEIEGLEWLQNSPRVTQLVIDERGFPLKMIVPDPRPFAVHKLWLSEQPSRDRAKARRDREQALTVAALVNDHLSGFDFGGAELHAFPANVRALAAQLREVGGSHDWPDWR
jgi:hypothetical protein